MPSLKLQHIWMSLKATFENILCNFLAVSWETSQRATQVGRHSLDKKGSTWALVCEIRKRKQKFSFSESCCTFQLVSDAPGHVLISCLTITQNIGEPFISTKAALTRGSRNEHCQWHDRQHQRCIDIQTTELQRWRYWLGRHRVKRYIDY